MKAGASKEMLLCDCGCGTTVKITPDYVIIGETDNIVKLKEFKWETLKQMIKAGEFDAER